MIHFIMYYLFIYILLCYVSHGASAFQCKDQGDPLLFHQEKGMGFYSSLSHRCRRKGCSVCPWGIELPCKIQGTQLSLSFW